MCYEEPSSAIEIILFTLETDTYEKFRRSSITVSLSNVYKVVSLEKNISSLLVTIKIRAEAWHMYRQDHCAQVDCISSLIFEVT